MSSDHAGIENVDGIIVVGSGLAAVGGLLGLFDSEYQGKVLVLDIGLQIHDGIDFCVANSRSEDKEVKQGQDSRKPWSLLKIPKKKIQNSTFFMDDINEAFALQCRSQAPPVSRALGGLAAGWGASVLPLGKVDYQRWGLGDNFLDLSYQSILTRIPHNFLVDDLADHFPLHSINTGRSLLGKHEAYILANLPRLDNFTAGHARLMVNTKSDGCISCGLCMSGCKHDAIYSPSSTLSQLIENPKLEYRRDFTVTRVESDSDSVLVTCVNRGAQHKFRCRRVLLGAGATATAQIILNSPEYSTSKVELSTRGGFLVPVLSLSGLLRFRKSTPHFTLPGIFLEQRIQGFEGHIHSQVSFQNELIDQATQSVKSSWLKKLLTKVRPMIGGILVNYSSHVSGKYILSDCREVNYNNVIINCEYIPRKPSLRLMFRYYFSTTPKLAKAGLLPLWPLKQWNSGTYHVGASFPMSNEAEIGRTSMLGQVSGIDRVHLVDCSVFPDIPASTVGLTILANAHRIGKEVGRMVSAHP